MGSLPWYFYTHGGRGWRVVVGKLLEGTCTVQKQVDECWVEASRGMSQPCPKEMHAHTCGSLLQPAGHRKKKVLICCLFTPAWKKKREKTLTVHSYRTDRFLAVSGPARNFCKTCETVWPFTQEGIIGLIFYVPSVIVLFLNKCLYLYFLTMYYQGRHFRFRGWKEQDSQHVLNSCSWMY